MPTTTRITFLPLLPWPVDPTETLLGLREPNGRIARRWITLKQLTETTVRKTKGVDVIRIELIPFRSSSLFRVCISSRLPRDHGSLRCQCSIRRRFPSKPQEVWRECELTSFVLSSRFRLDLIPFIWVSFPFQDYGGSQDSHHSSSLSRSESDEDRYPRTPSEFGQPPRIKDLEQEAGDRSSSYANFLSSANK